MHNMMNKQLPKLPLEGRHALSMQCRMASMDPKLSTEQRDSLRLAARYILGNTNSPEFDMLARLQILEGVAGVVTPGPKVSGPWSRNPRQGLRAARDHFSGTNINPEWFSTRNTGLVLRIRKMVERAARKWSRGHESHFTAEDILQNSLMGLRKDGETLLPYGPVLMLFGIKSKHLKSAIPAGNVTPVDVAGMASKFFVQRVGDQFKSVDRLKGPSQNEEGESVFDSMSTPTNSDSLTDFLADVLSRQGGMAQYLERKMRSLAGNSDLAQILIDRLVAGDYNFSISGLSKQLGGSGSGGSVRWVKDVFFPAVAKMVQRDPKLQDAYTLQMARFAAKRKSDRLAELRALRA